MREVGKVERSKRTYNISQEEFLKCEWIKLITDCDKFDIEYKNNYLVINTVKFLKQSEKEAIENANTRQHRTT